MDMFDFTNDYLFGGLWDRVEPFATGGWAGCLTSEDSDKNKEPDDTEDFTYDFYKPDPDGTVFLLTPYINHSVFKLRSIKKDLSTTQRIKAFKLADNIQNATEVKTI